MSFIKVFQIKFKNILSKRIFKNNKTALLIILFILGAVFLMPALSYAGTNDLLGIEFAKETGLTTTDIRVVIANIIRAALGLLGIIAVVIVIYGGFLWMTAGGDSGKIDTAKKVLINGGIGLAIILSAFAITQFVISSILGASTGGVGGVGTGSGGPGGTGGFGGGLGGGALGTVINSHYPARDSVDVARNTRIVISFAEKIDDKTIFSVVNNTNKLNSGNIKIFKTSDIDPIQREKFPNDSTKLVTDVDVVTKDSTTYTFIPKTYLGSASENVKYTVYLTSGIKKVDGSDIFNTRTPDYDWEFTTGTSIDITPPQVLYISPVDQAGCTIKCIDRNIVPQITFNEPVDPTTVSGDAPGFEFIRLTYDDGGTVNTVSGTYFISNQFRTITFVPSGKCDAAGKTQNSCGEEVTCMPGEKKITADIRSAALDAQLGGSVASSPYTGVVDLAGNSFDGNKDGTSTGPSANGECTKLDANCASGDNCCQDNDNFVWYYNTSNDVDLDPPQVIGIIPNLGASNVALDKNLEISFDKPLMGNSLYGSVVLHYFSSLNLQAVSQWQGAQSVDFASTAQASDFGKKIIWDHYGYELPASTDKETYYFLMELTNTLRDNAQNCFIAEETILSKCQRGDKQQFYPNYWNTSNGKVMTDYAQCNLTNQQYP